MDSVKWIFFEGGEPFLYYQCWSKGWKWLHRLDTKQASSATPLLGYQLEGRPGMAETLAPCVVQDLSVSSDLFHYSVKDQPTII